MTKVFTINILRWIAVLFLQVFLLNQINLHNTINPFIYILFIILLPLNIPIWALMVLGFLTGLSVDIFSNTLGLHAAATTLMAYLRPFVLRIVTPRGGYEHEPLPGIKNMGFRWFVTYTTILTLIHHIALFYLEVFRLNEFFFTFSRVLFSSIFTIVIILISQYLFLPVKRKK